MNQVLQLRGTVNRLGGSRKEGKRIASIKDQVDTIIQELEEYTNISKEGLVTATSNSNIKRIYFRTSRKK